MAIVQISKIIHRTGANIDLPQLDVGEIGFASDDRKAYIGNDVDLHPVPVGQTTTQTELLTDNSYIRFSQLNSATNLTGSDIVQTLYLKNVEDGQVIVANVDSPNAMTTWFNAGATGGGLINLGNVENIRILGAPGTTYVIKPSDTNGNLHWALNNTIENGTSNIKIPASGGNINMSVGGVANVLVITSTGANLTGTANIIGDTSITGNLTVSGATEFINVTRSAITDPIIELGGQSNGAALVTNDGKDRGHILHYYASGSTVDAFMGWDNSNAEFAFASNATLSSEVATFNTMGNLRADTYHGVSLQITGNANVGNLGSNAIIQAVGNITGANIISNNVVTANGNIETRGEVIITSNNAHGGAGYAGMITMTNTTVGSTNPNKYIRLNSTGALEVIDSAYSTTLLTLTNAGDISNPGNATITGNITGGNLKINDAANIVGNANVGNLGSGGQIFATGNITGANLMGPLANGTSNVKIPFADGNINLTVNGNANVAVVTGTGVNVFGTINSTGNLIAANLLTGGLADVTGNVTGGNINTGGQVRATGNITGSYMIGNLGGLIGGQANYTRFPNAMAIVSNTSAGIQQNESHNIGIVGEGTANPSNSTIWGIGIYGVGYTSGGTRSGGVVGEGHVSATGDTGSAIGVRGYSNDTHAGGYNIGLYADATGSGTGNYALYMNSGDIISIPAQIWTLVDNNSSALSIDAAGKTGILKVDTTNSAEGVSFSGYANVAGQIISTISTGTAPFVVTSTTEVANLTVATANTAGTVTTAAQPNITSVGTLSSLSVTGNISGSSYIIGPTVKTTPTTYSGLPVAATAGAGSRGYITDANTNVFGTQVSGSGSNSVPVWCNGTNWYVG